MDFSSKPNTKAFERHEISGQATSLAKHRGACFDSTSGNHMVITLPSTEVVLDRATVDLSTQHTRAASSIQEMAHQKDASIAEKGSILKRRTHREQQASRFTLFPEFMSTTLAPPYTTQPTHHLDQRHRQSSAPTASVSALASSAHQRQRLFALRLTHHRS